MIPRISAFSFSLICLSADSLAADLAYKKLSGSEYELVLSNDISLTVEQAQTMMQDPAATLCGVRKPRFGKYTFQATDAFTGQKTAGKAASFNMVQALSCVGDVPQVSPKAAAVATRLDADDEAKLRIEARKLTNAYLSAQENGYYETAYNMLGTVLKDASSLKGWQASAAAYQEQLGKPLQRDLWRVSINDSVPNPSQAGVYLSVNYEARYSETPMTCGYVVWFLPAGSKTNFTIMREEHGNIPTDVPTDLPASEQTRLRKQMGCRG